MHCRTVAVLIFVLSKNVATIFFRDWISSGSGWPEMATCWTSYLSELRQNPLHFLFVL